MRPTDILSSVLLFSATSSAWPWPPSAWQPVNAVKRELAPLVVRQDTKTSYNLDLSTLKQGNTATSSGQDSSATSDNNSDSATQTSNSDATSTNSNSDASSTGDSSSTDNGKSTGKTTGGTATTGKSSDTKKTSTQTSFSADLPAGGISMVTPNVYTTQYYKIGDYVTFAWNYTSLSITPSAVDVIATNTLNSQAYTIASNLSVSDTTQAVTWDTGDYTGADATATLLMATYTLIIHDAAKDVTATAAPGYLGTANTFTFAMYPPQPYEPIAEYQCITCSGALSSMQRMTLGFMFGMAGLTVLSFGWFAGNAGLI